jgi:hypothetical protein
LSLALYALPSVENIFVFFDKFCKIINAVHPLFWGAVRGGLPLTGPLLFFSFSDLVFDFHFQLERFNCMKYRTALFICGTAGDPGSAPSYPNFFGTASSYFSINYLTSHLFTFYYKGRGVNLGNGKTDIYPLV